jgi:hypothetical protein
MARRTSWSALSDTFQGTPNGAAGLGDAKGFRETRRATPLQERLRGGLQGIAREEDDTRAQVGLLALQEPVERRAVQLRHAHVAQNEVIGELVQLGQRQPPVRRQVHGVAIAAQETHQTGGQDHLVLDNQDSVPAPRRPLNSARRVGRWRRHRAHRQREAERGPVADLVANAQLRVLWSELRRRVFGFVK